MADPYGEGDEDADPHAAAFPRLPRRQRIAEEPQQPQVDPKLIAWANNAPRLMAEQAAARAEERRRLDEATAQLLHLNGKDLLDVPLAKRRAKLQALIERHDHPTVLFSDAFDDPHRLLAACEERRMEGIVSKRIDAPYRSGNASDWVKVKCAGWREANHERWRLFQKTDRSA